MHASVVRYGLLESAACKHEPCHTSRKLTMALALPGELVAFGHRTPQILLLIAIRCKRYVLGGLRPPRHREMQLTLRADGETKTFKFKPEIYKASTGLSAGAQRMCLLCSQS